MSILPDDGLRREVTGRGHGVAAADVLKACLAVDNCAPTPKVAPHDVLRQMSAERHIRSNACSTLV